MKRPPKFNGDVHEAVHQSDDRGGRDQDLTLGFELYFDL